MKAVLSVAAGFAAFGTIALASGSRTETENHVAEIKAPASCKSGVECAAAASLVTKNGYHTNAQYPYKFVLAEPAAAGVTHPKPRLNRADGTFEETRGGFRVPFTAAKTGRITIAGTLFQSVCSDAHCIVDKVALQVAIDVK